MHKRRRKALSLAGLFGMLASWLLWQLGPFQAVFAIASLSDLDKLATLGPRAANPRLNKIVYWLNVADQRFMPPGTAIDIAQGLNFTREPRAHLAKQALLRNLKIAHGLGLLDEENGKLLRNGKAGVITRGPYAKTKVEIDHIVPFSLAPEAGNELANLEMLPQELNRSKSDRVGPRQLSHAELLFAAGVITQESLSRVRARSLSSPPPRQ